MQPRHHKAIDLISGTKVCHSILISTPSGAYVESSVWPGRSIAWGTYTAGGELVHTYHDVNLAVHHAASLGGNQLDMGAWDGPWVVETAPPYAHADAAVAMSLALQAHADEIRTYKDFNL
jgi:hypothetical protein